MGQVSANVGIDKTVPRGCLDVAGRVGGGREHVGMVGGKEVDAQPELFHLGHALNPVRLRLGGGEGGQQEAGQNRDNGDHDQKFDQGEAAG